MKPLLTWTFSARLVLPFTNLHSDAPRVAVRFEGKVLELSDGANLAAALIEAGVHTFRRTPVSGAPRGAFCMMGACYDCLVEIDGVSRQACMLQVRSGLEITMPNMKGIENGR